MAGKQIKIIFSKKNKYKQYFYFFLNKIPIIYIL